MQKYSIISPIEDTFFKINFIVKKNRKNFLSLHKEKMPENLFKITPISVYPQDQKTFKEFFEKFLLEENFKNYCLVLPDSWIRTILLEEKNLPSNKKEIKNYIEWYFKKSYNLKPEEIRYSYEILDGQKNRLVLTFSFERLISSFETLFESFKKQIGAIFSSFWAIFFMLPKNGIWAFLNVERDVWSLGIFDGELPILFRQKIFPRQAPSLLIEELQRTINLFERKIDYFYLNLENDLVKKEEFELPLNFYEPFYENLNISFEPDLNWEKLKNKVLGVSIVLPKS